MNTGEQYLTTATTRIKTDLKKLLEKKCEGKGKELTVSSLIAEVLENRFVLELREIRKGGENGRS